MKKYYNISIMKKKRTNNRIMKTERKEKEEIVIKEECIYKGFVIFKCSKYYYYNGYTHVIITYMSVFNDINVGYYGSIASAKRAITKRTKKII